MLNNAIVTSITGHHFTYISSLLRMYQAIWSVMDWIPNEQLIGWQLIGTFPNIDYGKSFFFNSWNTVGYTSAIYSKPAKPVLFLY